MSEIAEECEDYRLILETLLGVDQVPEHFSDWIREVLEKWQDYNDEGIENENTKS